MKNICILLFLAASFAYSCTSSKKLAYLNNPEVLDSLKTDIPVYQIQSRDILFITIKAMTSDGRVTDLLTSSTGNSGINVSQGETGGYIYGFDVNPEGNITVPVIGSVKVGGLTIEECKKVLQEAADKVFKNSTVECKLLSFKFTVIGEVRVPGTYINYNNYLTILEAIGRAGGIDDYGDRCKILVVRTLNKGTKTFNINLQNKSLLSSEAYFLLPNDVVIVQPLKHKIFNMNLPTVSFILTSVTSVITTTLLLINYLK